jgi:hypothetical protein
MRESLAFFVTATGYACELDNQGEFFRGLRQVAGNGIAVAGGSLMVCAVGISSSAT